MSIIRSVSESELPSGNEKNTTIDNQQQDQTRRVPSTVDQNRRDPIVFFKAQTLDRFARSSAMSQHGEKRKKSFFASFRLNKKSISKKKDDQSSSGSDLSHTHEKTEDQQISSKKTDLSYDGDFKQKDSDSNINTSKSQRRYLNRMSSFVSKVAYKVQNGNDSNIISKSKLERSQTITGTDFAPQKPEYISFDSSQVPGVMGIRNHGNTCFINAVIQCLSHTDVLAEYFVLDYYKSDLARCNRINSKKYGTRGEITEHLSTVLKSLWVLRYIPDISLNLKNVIEKYEPCYRGSNQHDAAEFLMFILDKVHEDLNTASKRKYKKIKNSYGRPDEIVAAETLANHLRCNSSFVQDIFQAQFRSSLKCPHCLKESNTFDPYLCVSIPIPQHEVLAIFVTVVYFNQQPKQVKIGIRIEASATIKQLRHTVSEDCGIESDQLIITEIDGEGFHRTFADNASVNIIKSTDPVYAIELIAPNTSPMQENGAFIHIVWINVLLADPSDIRFGGTYQSQVARDISYSDLQKLLLKEMFSIVTIDTLVKEQDRGLFLIGLDIGSKNLVILEPNLDLPFLHQSVEDALSICHPLAGPSHIKLVLQWIAETKEKYITDDVDHVDEHSSVDELKRKPPECAPVSLGDCLQLHTSAEMLSCGDAWHCPTCNRKQQVLKRLTLWSAPQILVIHLKRFRQVSLSSNSSKLNTVVNFPLTGFDISDHMAGRYGSSASSNSVAANNAETNYNSSNKSLTGVWSPWKRAKKFNFSGNDHVYDLYAICNHHGEDLQGGHYTAVCRNPTNDRWYAFDDFNIEEISKDSIVDQDAYILFYQRREDISSASYPVTSDLKHWSYRIPLKSLPQNLKINHSLVDDKDTENKGEKIIGNVSENIKDKINDSRIPCEIEDLDNISCKNEEYIESKNVNSKSDELIKKTLGPNHFDTAGKLETVKVEISSCIDEKKQSTIVDIPNKPTEKNKLRSPEQCLEMHNDLVDKSKSSICNRLPSFRRDSNEIRDQSNRQCFKASNSHDIDRDQDCSNNEQETTTPDVRIQPASLEVLASHRYSSSVVVIQKDDKVSLRPKSQEKTSSRPSSTSSCSSGCSTSSSNQFLCENTQEEKLMNGYNSEAGCSTSSDDTPEIKINSTRTQLKHRQPNTNKTPSFVVIRTPTASPRPSVSRIGKSASNNSVMTKTLNGTGGLSRVRETYPSTIRNELNSHMERTLSLNGAHNSLMNCEQHLKVCNKTKMVNGKIHESNCEANLCVQKNLINDKKTILNDYCAEFRGKTADVGCLVSKNNSYSAQVIKRHELHKQVNKLEESENLVNGYECKQHQMFISSSIQSSLSKHSSDLCSYKMNKPCIMQFKTEDQFNQYVTESSV